MEQRLIWFQHIHKSAGTSIVQFAAENGETLFPHNRNANPSDENGQYLPIWEKNPAELRDFVDDCISSGISFVATERGAPDFDVLAADPRVVLLTCLRDPLRRCASNYNFSYYNGKTFAKSLDEYINDPHFFITDNHYVRIFSRAEQFPLPELTKEHYQAALDTLRKFDVVINLERDNLAKSLEHHFGWTTPQDHQKNKTFGNPVRVYRMIKRGRLKNVVNYIRRRDMAEDSSGVAQKFHLDMRLLQELSVE